MTDIHRQGLQLLRERDAKIVSIDDPALIYGSRDSELKLGAQLVIRWLKHMLLMISRTVRFVIR